MDAKSLKKLNRRELLEVMVKISEENEQLAHDNETMKAELDNRKLTAKEVGSLAQASLEANNFFTAAENAAKLYLENIMRIEQETKMRSSRLLEETLEECIRMRAAAGFGPDELLPPGWGAAAETAPSQAQAAGGIQDANAGTAEGVQAVPTAAGQTPEDAADAALAAFEQASDQTAGAIEEAAEEPKKKRGLFRRKK